MSLCQTCYSSLPPNTLATVYRTPCCDTPICATCLSRNPRLRYYDPCLRCGDVRTESGEARIKAGKARVREDHIAQEAGQFTIGDSDDDAEAEGEGNDDRPPSYSETAPLQHNAELAGSSWRRNSDSSSKKKTPQGVEGEDDTEIVEIKHPISGSDTLWSIAKRYGADPYDLLSLNSLPPSALTSNPRIIQTRKTLIIARRRLPRGSMPDSLLFDAGEALDPEDQKRREDERKVKRFQLITKTTDVGVGKAYLGLAEMEGDRHVLEDGSGEAMPADPDDPAGIGLPSRLGAEGGIRAGSGKKVRGGGKEDRALDWFWEDSAWEAEVGGPERVKVNGRWTVVGSGSPFAGLSIKS